MSIAVKNGLEFLALSGFIGIVNIFWFRAGVAQARSAFIERKSNPFGFWLVQAFNAILTVGLAICGIGLLFGIIRP